MYNNDLVVIMNSAIDALQKLNLVAYGSAAEREKRRLDCMRKIQIIIEQVRQVQDREAKSALQKENGE